MDIEIFVALIFFASILIFYAAVNQYSLAGTGALTMIVFVRAAPHLTPEWQWHHDSYYYFLVTESLLRTRHFHVPSEIATLYPFAEQKLQYFILPVVTTAISSTTGITDPRTLRIWVPVLFGPLLFIAAWAFFQRFLDEGWPLIAAYVYSMLDALLGQHLIYHQQAAGTYFAVLVLLTAVYPPARERIYLALLGTFSLLLFATHNFTPYVVVALLFSYFIIAYALTTIGIEEPRQALVNGIEYIFTGSTVVAITIYALVGQVYLSYIISTIQSYLLDIVRNAIDMISFGQTFDLDLMSASESQTTIDSTANHYNVETTTSSIDGASSERGPNESTSRVPRNTYKNLGGRSIIDQSAAITKLLLASLSIPQLIDSFKSRFSTSTGVLLILGGILGGITVFSYIIVPASLGRIVQIGYLFAVAVGIKAILKVLNSDRTPSAQALFFVFLLLSTLIVGNVLRGTTPSLIDHDSDIRSDAYHNVEPLSVSRATSAGQWLKSYYESGSVYAIYHLFMIPYYHGGIRNVSYLFAADKPGYGVYDSERRPYRTPSANVLYDNGRIFISKGTAPELDVYDESNTSQSG